MSTVSISLAMDDGTTESIQSIIVNMTKVIVAGIIIGWACIAAASDDHDEAKRLLDSGNILPLETILSKIRDTHQGKVLDVELEAEHGQTIYEVEFLTVDGVVLEVKVDASSGKILSTEKEY